MNKNVAFLLHLESAEKNNFVVVVEREVFITTDNFINAMLYLFGAYYSFNIAYTQLAHPVLIFLQRYVMGIEDTQSIPKCVREAVHDSDEKVYIKKYYNYITL